MLETAKLQGRIGLTGDERELLREHAYQIVDDTVIAKKNLICHFFQQRQQFRHY